MDKPRKSSKLNKGKTLMFEDVTIAKEVDKKESCKSKSHGKNKLDDEEYEIILKEFLLWFH